MSESETESETETVGVGAGTVRLLLAEVRTVNRLYRSWWRRPDRWVVSEWTTLGEVPEDGKVLFELPEGTRRVWVTEKRRTR